MSRPAHDTEWGERISDNSGVVLKIRDSPTGAIAIPGYVTYRQTSFQHIIFNLMLLFIANLLCITENVSELV